MAHEHIGKIAKRRAESHKGEYGKVLVIAGSRGMTGAAYLTSQAALRSGSGLVVCAVPESLNTIMEAKLTEVMTLPLPEGKEHWLTERSVEKILEFSETCDAVALGPGMGSHESTRRLIRILVEKLTPPIVLDADGINAFGGDPRALALRTGRMVITPHPGEMARLTGHTAVEVQESRISTARSVAEVTGCTVCLKGHRTVVSSFDGAIYTNTTGNSGMATAGTGDVLTGMIASFLGQGLDDFGAAVSAVFLHGLSGDIAAEKIGPFSLIAGDLIDHLPEAFRKSGIT